jgi:hypothetical protein
VYYSLYVIRNPHNSYIMARTRSKPAAKASNEATPAKTPTTNIKSLPLAVENAPKLFVLPKDTSKNTRIVKLDNPATGVPSRYLFCAQKGFYEFTRIAASKKACKSWLITSDGKDEEVKDSPEDELELGSGYVTKSPDIYIATPIDTLFLILPALAPKNSKDTKQLFLCLDDHLDTLSTSSPHWKSLLGLYPALKERIEKRMKLVCDTVDAGDETMYRLSREKLFGMLVKKAERMSVGTLPASLEEKFIKSALDVPIMNIKREESGLSEIPVLEDAATPSTNTESQVSTSTTTDSQGTVSTAATSLSSTTEEQAKPALTTPEGVPHLLRLRTSLTYLTSTYIPSTLHTPLSTLLASSTLPNFAPLTTYLTSLSALKSEALSLRSISDNISRKRGFEDDDEKVAEREEKKRKKEEDEKRKKQESRAVKQLKKVDVSGMKKMSSFFTKAPAKKV